MRQSGTHKLDWPDEICGELMSDLFIAKLFRRAEEPIARVADDHVDPAEFDEGLFHDVVDFRQVGHIEKRNPQTVAILGFQVIHRIQFADGSRHAVAALKQRLAHEAAESAVHAGDKPCSLCHSILPLCRRESIDSPRAFEPQFQNRMLGNTPFASTSVEMLTSCQASASAVRVSSACLAYRTASLPIRRCAGR